ncbi:MAG TPA: type II toxin-antitoxin system VapC family toxin, partial [Bryobacteraceae bacterium]|nr:type II toxin-antitoxin system VapC family toxin [Bryobacteraceae bacterium]
DDALPRMAKELISNQDNTVFLSSVSMWEIWMKVSLGKLRLPADFEKRLTDEAFEPLPLTAEHARGVGALEWHHRDPFDRMLVAQASLSRLRLLTADAKMSAYGDPVLVC